MAIDIKMNSIRKGSPLARIWLSVFLLGLGAFAACGGGSNSIQPPPPTGNNYTTQFSAPPAPENPISEGNNWINGFVTGLLWHDCRTTTNFVFGTQPGTINYDDSTCLLTGTWGTNQQAQGTVHIGTSDATQFEEVEIRLRSTITANSSTGYEINCSVKPGNAYMQVVRWNGGLGDFTFLTSTGSTGCVNGDVLKATATGSNPTTIKVYLNGTLTLTGVDHGTETGPGGAAGPWTTGSPGMGFYIQNGSIATNSDFGFSNFAATDQF